MKFEKKIITKQMNHIEKCRINGKPFYYDNRFGTIVSAQYHIGMSFIANPVDFINSIERVDNKFYVSISSEDREANVSVCYNIDHSFSVAGYDPVIIIKAILADPDCAKYLKEKGHPYYSGDYNKLIPSQYPDFQDSSDSEEEQIAVRYKLDILDFLNIKDQELLLVEYEKLKKQRDDYILNQVIKESMSTNDLFADNLFAIATPVVVPTAPYMEPREDNL
jgi:hypothetical protein